MQEWIPCSERPPSEPDRYLVTYKYHVYNVNKNEHHIVTGVDIKWFECDDWGDETVIAWMPLPAAYKSIDTGENTKPE